MVVNVYIAGGATQQQRTDLRNRLTALPNAKQRRLHLQAAGAPAAQSSRARALAQAFQLLGANPLPDTYRVVPRDPGKVGDILGALVRTDPVTGKRTFTIAGIGDVRNRESDTNKILSATSLVKALTAGMAALLILASIALIANTIRLSIFARRREVEVMKLVGATNWFIRWPFVIEGVIVGFMGGLVAVLLLWIIKDTLVDPLAHASR